MTFNLFGVLEPLAHPNILPKVNFKLPRILDKEKGPRVSFWGLRNLSFEAPRNRIRTLRVGCVLVVWDIGIRIRKGLGF